MKPVLLLLLGSVVVLSIVALICGAGITTCAIGIIVVALATAVGYLFTSEVPRRDWAKHIAGLENEAVVPLGAVALTLVGVGFSLVVGTTFPAAGHLANCFVIGLWAGVWFAPNTSSKRIPDRRATTLRSPSAPNPRRRR